MKKRDKKRFEFYLAALSILAAKGEMDLPALRDAIAERLGLKSTGRLGQLKRLRFDADAYVYMYELEAEGSVKCVVKRASDPARDAALKGKRRFHYSITGGGGLKRLELVQQQEQGARGGVPAGAGVPEPAKFQSSPAERTRAIVPAC